MIFLITYDITDNKRREKLSKFLEEIGVRLQYSVFECRINPKHLKNIKSEITKKINIAKDSVLIYQICASCVKSKIQIGKEYSIKFETLFTA